jgi:hypothetical protein
MVENFVEATPEEMRLVANYMEEPKQLLYNAIVKYETDTNLLGNVWSDDRYGIEFEKGYAPTHSNIIETSHAIVSGMSEIQSNLRKNAEIWEKTDEANQT